MNTAISIQNGPYAPSSSVVQVIKRFRDRGLPDPLNASALQQVGVSASIAGRTLGALKFLGLIDDEGHRTEKFERLKRVGNDEYQPALAEILRDAYSPVFSLINPELDDEPTISDAFRIYEPSAQRTRMVTLFLGLCGEAGIVSEEKRPKQNQPARRSPSLRRPPERKSDDNKAGRKEVPPPAESLRDESHELQTDYRLINVLLQQLPRDGKWTKKQRDRWMQAMTANIDLLLEVIDEPEQSDFRSSPSDH